MSPMPYVGSLNLVLLFKVHHPFIRGTLLLFIFSIPFISISSLVSIHLDKEVFSREVRFHMNV